MNKTTLLLLLYIFTGHASAGSVYKCDINGVITFSQQPCDDNLTPIVIKHRSGSNTKVKPKAITTNNKKAIKQLDEVKAYQLGQEIKRNEHTISRYEKKMNKELTVLKARTYSANNNLAGAIYQESLSSEMIAITNKYKILINGLKTKNIKLKERQLNLKL